MRQGGLRQRMAWLHTWCGLVCAWLLCVIFLAGTLSVFRAPISPWMGAEPTLPRDVRDVGKPAVLATAGRLLDQEGAGARFWRIELPPAWDRALRLIWRDASGVTREAAYDMYSHLTGGEEYVDEHSVDEYLERKAREAEEIARRNDELRKALRDGDMDRYNELLGRGASSKPEEGAAQQDPALGE